MIFYINNLYANLFYQIVLMKTKQTFKEKRNDLNFMKKKKTGGKKLSGQLGNKLSSSFLV